MALTPDNRPLTAIEAAMVGLYLMGMRYIASDDAGLTVSAYSEKPDLISDSDGYWWADGGTWIDFNDNGLGTPDITEVLARIAPDPVAVELLPWLLSHGITPPEVVG